MSFLTKTSLMAAFCLVLSLSFIPNAAHATGTAGQCGALNGGEFGTTPTDQSQLCTRGLPSSVTSSSSTWSWTCQGSGTSSNANCSATNCGTALPPTIGVCNNSTRNACSAGTPNDGAISDTAALYRWRCDGQNGGANSGTCSISRPIAGACNNSIRNACVAGTPNDGAISDTAALYRWRCDGQNGGSNSGTCSVAIPVAGVCNNTVQNACTAGTPNDGAISDTSLLYRWRCDGQNGGANSGTCIVAKPINGSCGGANGNSYADAAAVNTAGLCSVGSSSPSSAMGSGPWSWTCAGQNGGTTASCGATQTAGNGNGRVCSGGSVTGTARGGPAGDNAYGDTDLQIRNGVFSSITLPVNTEYSAILSETRTACRNSGGTCLQVDYEHFSEFGNEVDADLIVRCFSSPSVPSGTPDSGVDCSGAECRVFTFESEVP